VKALLKKLWIQSKNNPRVLIFDILLPVLYLYIVLESNQSVFDV